MAAFAGRGALLLVVAVAGVVSGRCVGALSKRELLRDISVKTACPGLDAAATGGSRAVVTFASPKGCSTGRRSLARSRQLPEMRRLAEDSTRSSPLASLVVEDSNSGAGRSPRGGDSGTEGVLLVL